METFKDELAIDPNALDVECIEQPEKFFRVAEQAAEAKREVDRCKLALEVTEAELDNDIRANPAKYGISKVTENSLKAALKVTEAYQKAAEALSNAKYENDMLQSATSAWDQRKRMLENLVDLFGKQYFAGPVIPRNIVDEMDKKRKIRNNK